jgi:hypothetical protein
MVAMILKVHVVFNGSGSTKTIKRGFSCRVVQASPEHYWMDRKNGKGGAMTNMALKGSRP